MKIEELIDKLIEIRDAGYHNSEVILNIDIIGDGDHDHFIPRDIYVYDDGIVCISNDVEE